MSGKKDGDDEKSDDVQVEIPKDTLTIKKKASSSWADQSEYTEAVSLLEDPLTTKKAEATATTTFKKKTVMSISRNKKKKSASNAMVIVAPSTEMSGWDTVDGGGFKIQRVTKKTALKTQKQTEMERSGVKLRDTNCFYFSECGTEAETGWPYCSACYEQKQGECGHCASMTTRLRSTPAGSFHKLCDGCKKH